MHKARHSYHFICFTRATLLTAILMSIDLAASLLIASPYWRIVYSDIASLAIDFLATIALFITAKQSAGVSKRLGIIWGMIALSALAFAMGDLSWSILELMMDVPPFPSIADVFYILYYPILLAGILLLPEKPTNREEQIKKGIDAGIVMLGAILVVWNFLIGPVVASNSPLVEQAFLLAYPVGDLVLLWALLHIMYRKSDGQDGYLPTFLLAVSIVLMIFADCVFSYQTLLNTFVTGGVLDVFWRGSISLMALAGISQATTMGTKKAGSFSLKFEYLLARIKGVMPYLSYLWIIPAYMLLIQGQVSPLPMDFRWLSLAVGGIISLVLFRQAITLFENTRLNAQLKQTMERLEDQTAQLSYTALHDFMTGLPNRITFSDRLGQAIEYCKRWPDSTFAVLFVDIDQFKVINDSLGHPTGDQLLIAAGRKMSECLRSTDTVARLGGDEFAILLEVTGQHMAAQLIAEKLLDAIKLPFTLNGHDLHVTASIGIVADVVGYDNVEEVLRDADIAMYQAKARGKSRFEVFDIQMRSHAFSRLRIEQELHAALDNKEFQLHYQPIVSICSGQLVSFEALIRWTHPTRGLLAPSEFITIAEESGLILPIGTWVLNEACAQLGKWHEKYPALQHVSVNVNISNRQFLQPDFIDEVLKAIRMSGLKSEALKLEITENVLISNYGAANKIFTNLNDQGVQIEIDDFGSGYSALGYLQHFPISTIKIDKSFIDEIGENRRGVELIRAIVSMARELGMETIAEGIETSEQLNELKSVECNLGQGFLLSKPLDSLSAEKILIEQAIFAPK